MISRSTDVRGALRSRQRGFLLNPARFGFLTPAQKIYGSLVSWWAFEENSAATTFADSHGSLPLSSRNTAGAVATSSVTTASGKVGRAYAPANVEGTTAYSTTLAFPDSNWTIFGWFQALNTLSVTGRFLFGRSGSADPQSQSGVFQELSTHQMTFQATPDSAGSPGTSVSLNSGFRPTDGKWFLLAASFNRSANLMEIRVRNDDAGSITKTNRSFTSALWTGSSVADFNVNDSSSSGGTAYYTGNRAGCNLADSVGYAAISFTDAEFDYLYNAGAGRSYAALAADGAP